MEGSKKGEYMRPDRISPPPKTLPAREAGAALQFVGARVDPFSKATIMGVAGIPLLVGFVESLIVQEVLHLEDPNGFYVGVCRVDQDVKLMQDDRRRNAKQKAFHA